MSDLHIAYSRTIERFDKIQNELEIYLEDHNFRLDGKCGKTLTDKGTCAVKALRSIWEILKN